MFKNEKERKVIRHALKQLINNEKLSDIKFSVGIENKIYYGIKALFAINSPRFNHLLYPSNQQEILIDFEEKKDIDDDLGGLDDDDENNGNLESLEKIICLNDITCKAFEFIQSYFYQNPKKLSVKYLVDILIAAQQFKLNNIEQKCLEAINSLKQTKKYIPYFVQIINELYYKGKRQIANDMLISTDYILVQFIFISITHHLSPQQQDTKHTKRPIFYGIAVKSLYFFSIHI